MRIFNVDDAGAPVDEVKTNERLAGVYDAVHVARSMGDGSYDLDFGDGSVMRIQVQGGQALDVGPQSMRNVNLDDMPHRAFDRSTTEQSTRADMGQFGAVFSDDLAQHPRHDDLPALEEC